ncbi:MAG: hypothetical protein DI535_17660 [Citrobacter freundii]|nr:MAG: hypothetical protein DI535_17660 [Citrobacter freundii]
MERIMLAINAVEMKEHPIGFACDLARLTNSELTGIFLENLVEDEQLTVRNAYEGTYIGLEVDRESPEFLAKKKIIDDNIARFSLICNTRGARSCVFRDERSPVSEAIRESRFADLLIADADTAFSKLQKSTPSAFVKRILRATACPVIVVPENVQPVQEIIFAYDGTASSMFAVRQFTYLFPELSSIKLIVLNASEREEAEIMLPPQLEEWLRAHYTSFVFEELHGKRLEILMDFLASRKNAILVMGSYGRSRVSRLINKSAADVLMSKTFLPLFIAHY